MQNDPRIETELPPVAASTVAPETASGRTRALAAMLAACSLAMLWVAAPLWVGILVGMVMAFTAQPTYRWTAQKLGDRRRLSAAVVTVLYGAGACTAGFLLVMAIARELFVIFGLLRQRVDAGSLASLVGVRGGQLLSRLGLDERQVLARLANELEHLSATAGAVLGTALNATSSLVVGFVIALFTMYYVLLQWWNITIRLERVLPIDPRHTRALMIEFRDVGRSAFVGTITTALLQGVLAGIGYSIAAVPQPLVWALLTGVASFLPMFGTALVWLPVAGWLVVAQDRAAAGAFVVLWGIVIVTSLTDYVLRPRLVGAQQHAHPLLMLVSLIGGFEAMGLAGLIGGPMIASLFLAMFNIYERVISNRPEPA